MEESFSIARADPEILKWAGQALCRHVALVHQIQGLGGGGGQVYPGWYLHMHCCIFRGHSVDMGQGRLLPLAWLPTAYWTMCWYGTCITHVFWCALCIQLNTGSFSLYMAGY